MNSNLIVFIALALAVTSASACARAPEASPPLRSAVDEASSDTSGSTTNTPKIVKTSDLSLPLVVVHKSESCGCCGLWVEHMQLAGFPVEVRNVDDVTPVKERLGIPLGKGSCHTAEVGGYFVEGHVPADDIKRLLAETPDAKGLVLPGMPAGSPGMETPDGRVQPYLVELVGENGASAPFARHGD